MSYTLSFSRQDGWLSVKASGQAESFDEFAAKAQTALERIKASGCKRILLDDREFVMSLDMHEITQIAAMLEKAKVQSLGFRLASLCRDEDRGTYRNIETIYQNRSISFRLFCEEDPAIDWLLS